MACVPARHPILRTRDRTLRVVGVKWTTAAGVARRAVETAIGLPGVRAVPEPAERPLDQGEVLRAAFLARHPGHGERLAPDPTLRRGDLLFAVEHEWAQTLEDVLLRRTGSASAGHPGRALVKSAADVLQPALGWSDAEKRAQIERFDAHPRFAGNLPP
jgi:glycerol-3-phosphate dehydrogenase